MKVIAILQARTSSSRLPNKVMMPLLGEPMLARQIERVLRAKKINALVVATSSESSDDPIAELCETLGVSCFRGSLDDVLDRYYRASLNFRPDHIVRLTGDCPLISPSVIDLVVQRHLDSDVQYTSNSIEPTFPDGLDVEVLKFSVLEELWQSAKLPSEREHVTLGVLSKSRSYLKLNVCAEKDLSQFRWTVDEPLDFEFVTSIYERLYVGNPSFDFYDVLEVLKQEPNLQEINSSYRRNEGLDTSLNNELNEVRK